VKDADLAMPCDGCGAGARRRSLVSWPLRVWVALALLAATSAQATEPCAVVVPAAADRAGAATPGSAQEHLERGTLLASRAEDALAIAEFDQAIRLEPTLLQARLRRGQAYAELGLQAEAIEDFSWIIDQTSGLAEAYLSRANARREAGLLQEALDDYASAIALKPDADAYFQRAIAWHRLDDFSHEQADWDKAIRLDPDLYWQYGTTYRHRLLYEGILSDHRTALQHAPDNAKAYYRRAEAYRYRGQPCAAISDYSRALELLPGYVDAQLGRGEALFAVGDHAGAIADLSDVLRRRPAVVEAYFYRALAHEVRGEHEAAVADLATAHEMAPFNPVIDAVREELRAKP
jgi:tetratricopeptide (TPR) repeat protein